MKNKCKKCNEPTENNWFCWSCNRKEIEKQVEREKKRETKKKELNKILSGTLDDLLKNENASEGLKIVILSIPKNKRHLYKVILEQKTKNISFEKIQVEKGIH